MRKSRDIDFITNVNKISSISLYKIITFRKKKKEISSHPFNLDLCEDMNKLIICSSLKLLCIITIQKLFGYHLKGVCSKLLKDHQKRLLRITSYDIYITHLMNYKHLLL